MQPTTIRLQTSIRSATEMTVHVVTTIAVNKAYYQVYSVDNNEGRTSLIHEESFSDERLAVAKFDKETECI